MFKKLLVVLTVLLSSNSLKAQDLSPFDPIVAEVGEALFKVFGKVASEAVGASLEEAIKESDYYKQLSKKYQVNIGLQDFALLLGLGEGHQNLCYALCTGWKSRFNNFKTKSQLYGLLLAEMNSDEGKLRRFFEEINSRSHLDYLANQYMNGAANAGLWGDWGKRVQGSKESKTPFIKAVLKAIDQIIAEEQKAMQLQLAHVSSKRKS